MVATDINLEKLQELKVEEPAVEIDRLDVTNGKEVEAIVQKHGHINVLFNCAG